VQEEESGKRLYNTHTMPSNYAGIKHISDVYLNILSNYLINHDEIPINHKENPWPKFNSRRTGFTTIINNTRKEKHFGKGIQFLPSDHKELQKDLTRLLGSYKAGNANTFNEISTITDALRRQGILEIYDIKKIFNYIK
jgi:hypothetical protein